MSASIVFVTASFFANVQHKNISMHEEKKITRNHIQKLAVKIDICITLS